MACSRKPGTPSGQQLADRLMLAWPASARSLCRRISSRAQGWRMGLLKSAIGWVGCRPVRRYSALVTRGCAGSWRTGPGPLGGGWNWLKSEIQPTAALGANSGTEAARAAVASANAATQSKDFDAIDMVHLPD